MGTHTLTVTVFWLVSIIGPCPDGFIQEAVSTLSPDYLKNSDVCNSSIQVRTNVMSGNMRSGQNVLGSRRLVAYNLDMFC